MTRAVMELRQIPFGYLIGAPLKAAIQAQAIAAKTTIEFIEKVGFIPEDSDDMLFVDEKADANAGTVRNVTFKYTKIDESNEKKTFTLTVPILSIVPIPYIRIDEMFIDFTAKLTDMIQTTLKTGFNYQTDVDVNYKAWWSPIAFEFRSSLSIEAQQERKSKFIREYTMNINVRAVQDDMPAGLARVLNILEQTIREEEEASS